MGRRRVEPRAEGASKPHGVREAETNVSLQSPSEFWGLYYMCFHIPNCKLVEKAYGGLLYNGFLAHPHDRRFENVLTGLLEVVHGRIAWKPGNREDIHVFLSPRNRTLSARS
jgi:hypothetical protein